MHTRFRYNEVMNVFWKKLCDESSVKDVPYLIEKQIHGDRQSKELANKSVGIILNLNEKPSIQTVNLVLLILESLKKQLPDTNLFVLSDMFFNDLEMSLKSQIEDVRFLQMEHFVKLKKHRGPLKIDFFGTAKKTQFLSIQYIAKSIFNADFIIPITLLNQDATFQMHGSLASFFWMNPTYTRNEILVQENNLQRCTSLIESIEKIFPKIHCVINISTAKPDPFIVLSQNAVSADAVSSILCGIHPSKNKLVFLSDKKNLGISVINRLNIFGEKIKTPIQNYELFNESFKMGISQDKCDLCADCTTFCPLKAIYIENNHLLWDNLKCNYCGYCISICPKIALFKRRK
ncbi:MAG: 4Fe-4S dicluster domain-containing protein [Caldisericia bacterium]|nr:4Fe-4S dicluster domain-containing protein [Caldisericia bacterium]